MCLKLCTSGGDLALLLDTLLISVSFFALLHSLSSSQCFPPSSSSSPPIPLSVFALYCFSILPLPTNYFSLLSLIFCLPSSSFLALPSFFRPPILGASQPNWGSKLLMEGISSCSSHVCRTVLSDRYRKRSGESVASDSCFSRTSGLVSKCGWNLYNLSDTSSLFAATQTWPFILFWTAELISKAPSISTNWLHQPWYPRKAAWLVLFIFLVEF